MKKELFGNIKIYQNKNKDHWSFGWKFEYKGKQYGNYIDNTEERTKEKLDCDNQIAMLKMMILAMELLIEKEVADKRNMMKNPIYDVSGKKMPIRI